jgi:hypothetical protein
MAEWETDAVAQRFAQAARTARRLPPVRVQGYFSVWPAFVRTEYERMAGDGDAPLRFPPTPKDVDQMLEAMRWVQWLEVDQRKLVWMRANRYRWAEIATCHGCVVRTAQRRWEIAVWAVTQNLNGKNIF